MFKCRVPGWFHKDCNSRPTFGQIIIAGLGSFIGIATVSYLSLHYKLALLVPSFGASAVLLYAASHVPMAQPKNVLGGHLVSALIGVTVFKLWGLAWWTIALGVTLAITGMLFTDTLHPPGGATAFAAVFTQQNYSFVFMPVTIGAIILVAIALLIHNTGGQRRYPIRRGVSARVPVAAEVGIEGQSPFNLKEKDL
ncbi:HPP family protein [Thermincola potens]|uniref:HPP family protein n=1 Tax=Thermincola potens (strain JR) TaxID=635013 RepID=D5XEJ2_THEPJ|nr:HPP family protein [Thermincola potens]ADG82063.1 HPP family protein [Thermincola potens JR]